MPPEPLPDGVHHALGGGWRAHGAVIDEVSVVGVERSKGSREVRALLLDALERDEVVEHAVGRQADADPAASAVATGDLDDESVVGLGAAALRVCAQVEELIEQVAAGGVHLDAVEARRDGVAAGGDVLLDGRSRGLRRSSRGAWSGAGRDALGDQRPGVCALGVVAGHQVIGDVVDGPRAGHRCHHDPVAEGGAEGGLRHPKDADLTSQSAA